MTSAGDVVVTDDVVRPAVRRRARRMTLLALVALVTVVLLALAAGGSRASRPPADPDSASRDGTRALVEVLRQQGVAVKVVRSIEAFESTSVDARSTVVVGSFAYLGRAAAQRTTVHASPAGRVVLLEPSDVALSDLGVPLTTSGRSSATLTARCTSGVANPSDTLSGSSTLYRARADASAAQGTTRCFEPAGDKTSPGGGSSGSAAGQGAALVILAPDGGRPETVVFGDVGALANAAVTDESHAALGLRLLGATPRLVWYYPDVTDVDVADPNGRHLGGSDRAIPAWFTPGIVLLSLTFVAFALARGRRLGRIVAEPLPVVVRAAETTEARGRLYRQAADRGRAAWNLRSGARARLASRLGVPTQAPARELVEAVARSANRSPQEVQVLLDGPAPGTDSALVQLAHQLAQLEETVRHP